MISTIKTHLPRILWATVIALQVFLAGNVLAESKSGVDPRVISLPKGPGSIEGLGESFEPQLNTGTATYRIKIAISPGVNKHQPEVALEYNGGYGNSPLGLGWNLNLENIQRQTDKGLPAYTDNDTFVYSKSGELVPLDGGIYRLKIEGPFMKFHKNGEAWEAWRKNGTHLFFGTTVNSRQTTTNGTFQWCIDKEVDTNGNEIRYFYETDGGQIYLSEIRYSIMGEAVFKSVAFEYTERPDAFTDYHSRSRVLTAKRLAAINVLSNSKLVRQYRLQYKEGTDFSLLSQVLQIGADGQSPLPPVTFDYTVYNPQSIRTVAMANPPPAEISLSNNEVDLVDIDGDSLPDLVHTASAAGIHYFHLNQGRGKWAENPTVPDRSPQYSLSSNGVMMADMNGDGLADLFVKTADMFGYFRNKGDVKWEEADWQACSPSYTGFSFEAENVRLVDVNNDKLIDVMMDAGPSGYHVWLNRKNNQWNDEFDDTPQLPNGSHLDFSSPYTKMGDMNGDRMQDLVFVLDGHVSYFPSKGNGEFDAETLLNNPPLGIADAGDRLVVSDINNDGLADIVRIGNENITVWFNAGNNAFKDPVIFEETPSYSGGTTSFRFADMNGDGFTDLLMIDANSPAPYQYVDFNNGIHPNLLTKISNGLGREINIAYKSSTEYYLDDRDNGKPWQTKLPFPVYVVSTVAVKDNAGGNQYVTEYAYRDGYYDGAEKEFRGFGEVNKTTSGDATAPTLVTRYVFDVGKEEESKKGLIKFLAALAENGAVDPPSGVFDMHNNTLVTTDIKKGTNDERIRYSYISQTDTLLYENTESPKQTRQVIVHDNYGNTTEESDYGLVKDGDLAGGKDEVRTFTSYLIDVANWMVDRPVDIRKVDNAGNFISHQKNHYDAKGNLLSQEGAISDGDSVTLIANTYDAHGNIITMTDANGHWRTIGYDPMFHTFPVSETIEQTGLSMTAEYDTGPGVITSFTDFNGHVTSFGYDTFGRLTAIAKPGDSLALPTQQFTYTLANPISSVMSQSRETSGAGNTYDAITYYDGLGRKLQTRSAGPTGNWVVSDAATFNQQGGIKTKWLPHFKDSMAFAYPDPAYPFISFTYDAKGRSIKETNPDGTYKSTEYLPLETRVSDEEDNSIGPHAGTAHAFVNDGLDRLVEVREQNGAQTYVTRYEYDGQNNLIMIRDNEGNVKIMQFDGLGRKTSMNDPDKHEMNYAYDPAGNLTSTTDAKGQTVSYIYDPANRIVTETYDGVKVRYHYDADLPANYSELQNTMGKLSYVEDEAGKEYYGYDARGNLALKIREAAGYTFVNRMAYDAMDRLTALTYPDGFTVNYRYNAMNQLAEVPGFVAEIDYITTGQKSAFVYANGLKSTYAYDSRQRMTRLATENSGKVLQDLSYIYDAVNNITSISDGRPEKTTEDNTRTFAYDDLYRLTQAIAPAWTETYQYNSIGNMTSKSDVGVMTYGENGAGPHAVTRAEGAGFTYAYDQNGNIASKNPGYTYQFDHKDRMTAAKRAADNTDIAYAYDYKGNRVTKRVATGEAAATTVYADNFTELRQNTMVKQIFAGDRLVARIFSPFTPAVLETRLHPLTVDDFDKNPQDGVITLDEIRRQGADPEKMEVLAVADALRIYQDNLDTRPGLLSFETMAKAFNDLGGARVDGVGSETVYYYLPDHLGSASIVTNADATVLEESLYYYPYGADRPRTGSFESEYRFTGKELDDETGLHYFGARYYDAQVGRFVSVDPLYVERHDSKSHRTESLNLYVYAENNPINSRDFSGLFRIEAGSLSIDPITVFSRLGENALGMASKGNGPGFKVFSGMQKAAVAAIEGKTGEALYQVAKTHADIIAMALKNNIAEKFNNYIDTVDTTKDVLDNGLDELSERGYSLADLKKSILDAPELIKFGIDNPDAFIQAGIEGVTSTTAVTINTIVNLETRGMVDRVVTGKQIQKGIEDFLDNMSLTLKPMSVGGGGGGAW